MSKDEIIKDADIEDLDEEQLYQFNTEIDAFIAHLEVDGKKSRLPLKGEGLEHFLEADYWGKHDAMKYWQKHHSVVFFIPKNNLQAEEVLNWLRKSKKCFVHNRSEIIGRNYMFIFRG